MNILLLGKYGQLGWELRRALAPAGHVIALDYPEIDLLQEGNVRKIVRTYHPEVIINATAYTAVDKAESEPEIAMAINARAPGLLAEEALRLGALLIHYSTDYVFDGNKGSEYLESDSPNPLGVYGQSKLDGERFIQAVGGDTLILRTSWVYSLRRESFVTKVLQWSRQQPVLRLVSDQVSNPTWARMLAEATTLLLVKGGESWREWLGERRGLYHLAGSGYASRLEWAQAILRLDPKQAEQVVQQIQPALTADFPTPAQRPLFSALNCDLFPRTFGLSLPPWDDALALAMENNYG
jgi:dTDP-4-dehydrorhamnose reductase